MPSKTPYLEMVKSKKAKENKTHAHKEHQQSYIFTTISMYIHNLHAKLLIALISVETLI